VCHFCIQTLCHRFDISKYVLTRILAQVPTFIFYVREILGIFANTPIFMTCLCSVRMSFQTNPGVISHSRPRIVSSLFTPFRYTFLILPFDAVSSGIMTVTLDNIKITEISNVPTPLLIHSTPSSFPCPVLSENINIWHSRIGNLKAISEWLHQNW
jgi:hypothetical protein